MFLDISGEICSSVWLERSGRPVKHLTLYFRPLAGTANLVPFNSTVFLPKMQNVTGVQSMLRKLSVFGLETAAPEEVDMASEEVALPMQGAGVIT